MFDQDDSAYGGPLVAEVDVIGLYPGAQAAAASRTTWSDPGSGPMGPDD